MFAVDESFTPMMPPVGLKTHVLSSSTIVLTWTDTSLGVNQMIQDNRYYTVRYRVASNMESENSRYVNTHSESNRWKVKVTLTVDSENSMWGRLWFVLGATKLQLNGMSFSSDDVL